MDEAVALVLDKRGNEPDNCRGFQRASRGDAIAGGIKGGRCNRLGKLMWGPTSFVGRCCCLRHGGLN